MKVTTLGSLACLLLVTAAFSCKKSNSSTSKSKTELLTQTSWKIERSGIDADMNGSIDLPETHDACELDDTFKFEAGGAGVYNNNALICEVGDPQSESFTWAFKTNETILFASLTNFNGDAMVKTINENTLEVCQDISTGMGTVRYVIRFKH